MQPQAAHQKGDVYLTRQQRVLLLRDQRREHRISHRIAATFLICSSHQEGARQQQMP
jgi:hypothetical protein